MKNFQSKIEYLREQLGIHPEVLAINTGSWGALCKDALHGAVDEFYKDALSKRYAQGVFKKIMLDILNEDRKEMAEFLNCSSEEIALCESTTSGMNICLWGYNFEPGDEIISGSLENPAGFSPLNTIAHRRGVVVKYADLGRAGEKDGVEEIRALITPKTKMVLISHVTYLTGAAVDAKGISKLCREHGILSVFDGVQAVGTMKVDVQEIGCDSYALARHKYLNGPDGAGALYVREDALNKIEPTFSGVFTDKHHGTLGYNPMDSAVKYDISTRPYYVQASAVATMKWLKNKVGFDFIYDRIRTLRAKLFDLMEKIPNVEMISIRENSENSALILFDIKGRDCKDLSDFLIENKVYNRVANHWYPPEFTKLITGVRISVNYWNTEEDIEKIAALIRRATEMK